MGTSVRIFLVNDDDSIQRMPLTKFERLIQRDPKERRPQYAGKRLRYVEVILELLRRKPVQILRVQYFILPFDLEGMIDAAEQERERRLGVEMMPPLLFDEQNKRVVDARHHFAKKQFDNEYRWTPTPKIEAAVMEAIFGED